MVWVVLKCCLDIIIISSSFINWIMLSQLLLVLQYLFDFYLVLSKSTGMINMNVILFLGPVMKIPFGKVKAKVLLVMKMANL